MSILREAFQLNIFEINYRYGTQGFFERTLLADPSALPRRGILFRILVFWAHFGKAFNPRNWFKELSIPKQKILFFATSKNQRDSLKSKQDEAGRMLLIGPGGNYPYDLTQFLAHFFSLGFFVLILYQLLIARGSRRKSFAYVFDQYWLTYGFYIAGCLMLRKLAPKALVLANDHNFAHRTIILAARREKIPVIYIQHASVSDEFPPLSMDYALLDGLDAATIYDQAGKSETKVFLIGMAKADRFFKDINRGTDIKTVGICTNLFDPPQRVDELCKALASDSLGVDLIFRPHPRDQRKQKWLEMTEQYHIRVSDSQVEDSFDFLKGVDTILAGNSNIHLEAALMNVYPIYYDFALDRRVEKYTFVSKGLCESINQPEQVIGRLRELMVFRPSIRHRAKTYCVTIDTPYDGHSRELAQKIIYQIAEGEEIDLADWQRIQGKNLEIYEPCPNV